jgi:hypothetical protein
MKTVSVESLRGDAFGEFGHFQDMLSPASEVLGARTAVLADEDCLLISSQ